MAIKDSIITPQRKETLGLTTKNSITFSEKDALMTPVKNLMRLVDNQD